MSGATDNPPMRIGVGALVGVKTRYSRPVIENDPPVVLRLNCEDPQS